MEVFLQLLITGVMVGSIYALVALGWTLIYKCSGVLNLAMGELTLIGAYVCLSFYNWGVPFLLALLATLVIGFLLGLLTERIFLQRLIGEPLLTVIMVTVGLSFFFRGIVAFLWGADTQVFKPSVFPVAPANPMIAATIENWTQRTSAYSRVSDPLARSWEEKVKNACCVPVSRTPRRVDEVESRKL